MAHACGVSVEGEIGCLGSLETGMAGEEDGVGAEGVLDHSQLLTSVEEARQFVADTNVDISHCSGYFSRCIQVYSSTYRRYSCN